MIVVLYSTAARVSTDTVEQRGVHGNVMDWSNGRWETDFALGESTTASGNKRKTEQTTEILIHRQLTLVPALPWIPRCACDAICCLHYAVR